VVFVAVVAGVGVAVAGHVIDRARTGDPAPAGICVQTFRVPLDPAAEAGQIVTSVTAPTLSASGVLVCETGTFVPISPSGGRP
jgi:hypothetical protein